jgi:hypothetical protein
MQISLEPCLRAALEPDRLGWKLLASISGRESGSFEIDATLIHVSGHQPETIKAVTVDRWLSNSFALNPPP